MSIGCPLVLLVQERACTSMPMAHSSSICRFSSHLQSPLLPSVTRTLRCAPSSAPRSLPVKRFVTAQNSYHCAPPCHLPRGAPGARQCPCAGRTLISTQRTRLGPTVACILYPLQRECGFTLHLAESSWAGVQKNMWWPCPGLYPSANTLNPSANGENGLT